MSSSSSSLAISLSDIPIAPGAASGRASKPKLRHGAREFLATCEGDGLRVTDNPFGDEGSFLLLEDDMRAWLQRAHGRERAVRRDAQPRNSNGYYTIVGAGLRGGGPDPG